MLTVSAVDDTIAVRRLDVTLGIDVLANDSATNGALVIDSFTQPAHGTVALVAGTGGANDRLAYTPSSGYAGSDAFTYTIEDDDGLPETGDVSVTLAAPASAVDPGGPRGAGYYALSDGFVVGPFAAYTRTALGNFTFTDSKSTDDNSTWTDGDGIVHNVAASGLEALVVTSTEAADGSWTYDESLTSGGQASMSPVSGTAGLTQAWSASYAYAFAAAGSASGSGYTFSADGGQSASGSFVYAWNTADGASGSTTTPFTQSTSFSADITNAFDASSSTGSTGTSLLNGESDFSSTTTGSYSYTAGTGTVSGTISGSESSGDSYAYTESSGTYSASGMSTSAYSGAGTYAYSSTDGLSNGTITESGGHSNWYQLATLATFSSGTWTETGSGSSTDDSIYSGGGTYADSGASDSIGGTNCQSGGEHLSANSQWTQTLGSDGKWLLTSGSASGNYSASGHSAYSGDGSYSRTFTSGSASGALVESGGMDQSADSTWSEVVDGDGNWQLDSGTSVEQVSSSANWSYGGSGNYSYLMGDEPAPGTITEDGGQSSSSTYTINSSVSGGAWVDTGTGTGEFHSHDNSAYGYSGGYAYAYSADSSGSPVSGSGGGTLTESGEDHQSEDFSWGESLGTDGKWSLASGSGAISASASQDSAYSGVGSYSYPMGNDTVTGITTETGGQSSSSHYTINSIVSAGAWVDTGTGSGEFHNHGNSTYDGGGGYAYSYSSDSGSGSDSGTVTEGGGDYSAEDFSWDQSLGTDGKWSLSSGCGTMSASNYQDSAYSGGGNYSYPMGNDTVTGITTETGGQCASSHYTVNSSASGGAWVDTGTGSGDFHNYDNSTYEGGGGYAYSYSSDSTSGSNSGTITEGGEDQQSEYFSWDQSLGTDGKWNLSSGSGTMSASNYQDSAYSGGGNYSYAVPGGTVDGTTTEAGGGYSLSEATWGVLLGSDGKWQLHSGMGTAQGGSIASSSYSGSGSCTQAVHDGTTSGGISESGQDSQSAAWTVNSVVDNGVWFNSGSATACAQGSGDSGYSGGGTYARPGSNGGTISGTLQQDGSAGYSYHYDVTQAIGADGQWVATSGSAGSSQNGTDNFSFAGGLDGVTDTAMQETGNDQ